MRLPLLYGLLLVLLCGPQAANGTVRIADDRGGRIGAYVERYRGLRSSGENVVIDGLCASACTIVLGAVPFDKICVTSHANLGFHAAYDLYATLNSTREASVTNPEATHYLYSLYPAQVQRWIARHGGLTPHMIFLRGKQLRALYHPCTVHAQIKF